MTITIGIPDLKSIHFQKVHCKTKGRKTLKVSIKKIPNKSIVDFLISRRILDSFLKKFMDPKNQFGKIPEGIPIPKEFRFFFPEIHGRLSKFFNKFLYEFLKKSERIPGEMKIFLLESLVQFL